MTRPDDPPPRRRWTRPEHRMSVIRPGATSRSQRSLPGIRRPQRRSAEPVPAITRPPLGVRQGGPQQTWSDRHLAPREDECAEFSGRPVEPVAGPSLRHPTSPPGAAGPRIPALACAHGHWYPAAQSANRWVDGTWMAEVRATWQRPEARSPPDGSWRLGSRSRPCRRVLHVIRPGVLEWRSRIRRLGRTRRPRVRDAGVSLLAAGGPGGDHRAQRFARWRGARPAGSGRPGCRRRGPAEGRRRD